MESETKAGVWHGDPRSLKMHPPVSSQDGAVAAVAEAVERMVAKALARGLPPLAILGGYGFVTGLLGGFRDADPWILSVGALVSMITMAAWALQAVQKVLEKPGRWSTLSPVGAYVPLLFAGYVMVTRLLGLVGVIETGGGEAVLISVGVIALGGLCLRAQWKLTELHLLAGEMAGVARTPMSPPRT